MAALRTTPSEPFEAVVLAGGAARRLGGQDKPSLTVGAVSLLDVVLAAVGGAARTVVVGPRRQTGRAVSWTREEPERAGPAAAIEAGLRLVREPLVVVVAADLPFLDAAVVDALVQAAAGRDGALLLDDHGREQWLLGAWSADALRQAASTVDHRQSSGAWSVSWTGTRLPRAVGPPSVVGLRHG